MEPLECLESKVKDSPERMVTSVYWKGLVQQQGSLKGVSSRVRTEMGWKSQKLEPLSPRVLFRLYISYHTIVILYPTQHPSPILIHFAIFLSFITIVVNFIFSHTRPSFYPSLSPFPLHLTSHKLSSFLSQLTFFFPSNNSLISFHLS
ncbi:hypothetical protein HJG60_009003 [Phyllostomus discolor]|uniref:Uncharacterized protein n=1 Tax=Phyllostomus discolor TaxID=89673 RepID=A0A834DCN2_9CHIR|nr:hypothetical protein HJG60_009003 [Phyllostomus discolor]